MLGCDVDGTGRAALGGEHALQRRAQLRERRRLAPPARSLASGLQNFSHCLGTAALLSFPAACCRRDIAATEYALLSALFAATAPGVMATRRASR